MKISNRFSLLLPLATVIAIAGIAIAKNESEPATATAKTIKALMVTGEGYHDYKAQKKIISDGVGERLNIDWEILHHKTPAECKKDLGKAGWAEGYDIVVYNICHAKEADTKFIDSIAAVHEAGKPAVALHCTMHSFHWNVKAEGGNDSDKTWVKFLGVRSRNHGPKAAIKVHKLKPDHPVVKDLPEGWTTPEGELYNILEVLPTATALADGDNGNEKQGKQVCIWVNQYGKGKVFGTTIGHHNSTMKTKEYLDLLANGITWALEE
ncbi:MAG: ThuA domain-containing protein [Verrucomicrobiales bacterium]